MKIAFCARDWSHTMVGCCWYSNNYNLLVSGLCPGDI